MQLNYNVNDLPKDEGNSFELLPKGKYDAFVKAVEQRTTRDGRGSYLAVKFEIVSGEYAKRVVFHNITLTNASAKAEEIGKKQLRTLMEARNLVTISDDQQLIGATVTLNVDIESDPGYDDRNTVRGISLKTGATPAPQAAPTPYTRQTPPTTPPWAK